jgi:hypothetical protein
MELLDPASETHALDVVSVIESILEDPSPVLTAQVKAAKGALVAELKAAGVEYEERMERLAEVTHPKPLAELLGAAYDTFGGSHPWIADHPLRPKSVVRDLWERAMTFNDYVQHYGLPRSEGLLLRYLTDAYKALVQTVPETAKTDALDDLTAWLGELVRQVDSSLLDEWEALAHPEAVVLAPPPLDAAPPPVTANARAFRVLVRNELFRRVELAALRNRAELAELDPDAGWPAALDAYFAEHDGIGTGPDARGPECFVLHETGRTWRARQILDDPAGDHDWSITAEVDLDASDEAGTAVVRVLSVSCS